MSDGLTLSGYLDILIAALLVATIGYAFALNRKLARLRRTKDELESLAARLIESTERARQGLEALREHARQVGERLQGGIEMARGRADELAFLVEKGQALSLRLDGALGAPGLKAPATAAPAATGAKGAADRGRPKVEAQASPEEANLLKALRGLR